MAKNKIIKGNIPYLDLNRNLNFEQEEKDIKEFLESLSDRSEEE
jgi:hypothetical protein